MNFIQRLLHTGLPFSNFLRSRNWNWRHYRSTMWFLAKSTAPISILGWFLCCNVLREKLPQTDHTTHTITTIASLLGWYKFSTKKNRKKSRKLGSKTTFEKKTTRKIWNLRTPINLIKNHTFNTSEVGSWFIPTVSKSSKDRWNYPFPTNFLCP